MEYIEIINKLIGDINSVGSSQVDCFRYENLEEYCELVYDMVNEICFEARKSKRIEYSMKKNGLKSIECLKNIRQMIDECLGDVKE